MKSLVKKIIIYSMVGIMQLGLGATVIEASPRHNNQQEQYQNDNNSDNWNGGRYEQQSYDRHHNQDAQIREENYRHDRDMCRRDGESDRDWHDRQRHENERHDDAAKAIAAGAIIYLLGRLSSQVRHFVQEYLNRRFPAQAFTWS